jgi:hypothetical protein
MDRCGGERASSSVRRLRHGAEVACGPVVGALGRRGGGLRAQISPKH